MPHRNRVTPRSEIIATPARGTRMGNRGILHNGRQQIVRNHVSKRWIICLTSFKGRKLEILAKGAYTQLFFLDEVTALAAGHRPCAECQRERFLDFRGHWAQANPDLAGSTGPLVDVIDDALHAERIAGDRWSGWRKMTYVTTLSDLPDGVFVLLHGDDTPYLVNDGALYPWRPEGYGAPRLVDSTTRVEVLTPRSVVRAVEHGYQPSVHASIQTTASTSGDTGDF